MTPRYRRILLLCGLLPTLAAAVLSLTRPAALANIEYAVYDRLVRWTPTRQPSGKIVIVDVDEKSLKRIGFMYFDNKRTPDYWADKKGYDYFIGL